MLLTRPDLLEPLAVRVPAPATIPVPQHLYDRLHAAIRIANQAVVADIETTCPALRSPCGRFSWYDTRPMLDEREHCAAVVDMAREAITYGVDTGLLVRHDEHPHWVRVARPGC